MTTAKLASILRGVTSKRTPEKPAQVDDIAELASAMPGVTVEIGPAGNAVYQVRRKSFVFFRTPRPDAFDPDTGERYTDVIVFWVESDEDKLALVQDDSSPYFTTPHFDGHRSVLLRASRIGVISRTELTELIQDAWLARTRPPSPHLAGRTRSGLASPADFVCWLGRCDHRAERCGSVEKGP